MKQKKLISIVSIVLAALAAIPTVYAQNTPPLQAEEPTAVSVPELADDAVLTVREVRFAAQPDPLRETAATQAQRDAAAEHISFDRKDTSPAGQLPVHQAAVSQAPVSQAAANQSVQDQEISTNQFLLPFTAGETEGAENEAKKTASASSTGLITLGADDYSQSYMNSVYYQRLKAVSLTGDYRSDLLAVAESQLGYRESSSESQLDGSGSGGGDYTEYGRFCNTNGSAWCSEFATWCARQAGIPTSVLGDSTSARADRFGGTYHPWSDTIYAGGRFQPRPGDLVFFAWSKSSLTAVSKDHTAILISVEWTADSLVVYTLDGNSGNKVQRNTRRVTDLSDGKVSGGWIAGFIAPNYGDGDGMIQGTVSAPSPAKPAAPAVAEAELPVEDPAEDTVTTPEEDVVEQFPDISNDDTPEENIGEQSPDIFNDADDTPADPPAEEPEDEVEMQLPEISDKSSDDRPEGTALDTPVGETSTEEILSEADLMV